jgi:hypothetical protein
MIRTGEEYRAGCLTDAIERHRYLSVRNRSDRCFLRCLSVRKPVSEGLGLALIRPLPDGRLGVSKCPKRDNYHVSKLRAEFVSKITIRLSRVAEG